jgi:hypothetical protein
MGFALKLFKIRNEIIIQAIISPHVRLVPTPNDFIGATLQTKPSASFCRWLMGMEIFTKVKPVIWLLLRI